MQLYILDRDPVKSAQLIPDKYKFKMLIELGQLICSAGLSDVYKPIAQGKELQQWVKENTLYIKYYFYELFIWTRENIRMSRETNSKLMKIYSDLIFESSLENCSIDSAYFRYACTYQCAIPSKTLLPIDECIRQYKKYLEWKLDDTK